MTETDKAREWFLAKHKRETAHISTHNRKASCVICEQRVDANWSIDEVAAYGAAQYEAGKLSARASKSSPPQPLGTYACPICGCATPHAHSEEQIAEWRKKEIVENRNNVSWDDLSTDQFRRIKAAIHRLFPLIPTVGLVANLVEDAEKLIMADRELLARVSAETNSPNYGDRYFRLKAIVETVLGNKGFGPESTGAAATAPSAPPTCPVCHSTDPTDPGKLNEAPVAYCDHLFHGSSDPGEAAPSAPTATDLINHLLLCWSVFYAKLPHGEYDGLGELRIALTNLREYAGEHAGADKEKP